MKELLVPPTDSKIIRVASLVEAPTYLTSTSTRTTNVTSPLSSSSFTQPSRTGSNSGYKSSIRFGQRNKWFKIRSNTTAFDNSHETSQMNTELKRQLSSEDQQLRPSSRRLSQRDNYSTDEPNPSAILRQSDRSTKENQVNRTEKSDTPEQSEILDSPHADDSDKFFDENIHRISLMLAESGIKNEATNRNTESDSNEVEYPLDIPTIREAEISSQYTVLHDIERGQFGMVRKCKELTSGQEFAAKSIPLPVDHPLTDDINEVIILRAVGKHPQIAFLQAVFQSPTQCTIVTQLATGGQLLKRIEDEYSLSEADARSYTQQVLLGLEHLKHRGIVHLDIKPENLLLVEPMSRKLKIIDFGFAFFVKDSIAHYSMAGTLTYSAPETHCYRPQSFATDLWSVGILAYELLSGLTPFEVHMGEPEERHLTEKEIAKRITQCKYTLDYEDIDHVSREAKDFIRQILVLNETLRPRVEECLEHAWIKKPEDEMSVKRREPSVGRPKSDMYLQRVSAPSCVEDQRNEQSPT